MVRPKLLFFLIALTSQISLDAFGNEFRIESESGAELITFFETGDVHIALGDIYEGTNAILVENSAISEFIIENSIGDVVFRIPDDTGDLHIAGLIQQQLPSPLSPPANSFVIENQNDEIVAYIDNEGNLAAKGRIYLHGRPVQRVKGGGSWGGHSADVDFSDFADTPGRAIIEDFTLDREASFEGNDIVLADTLDLASFSNDVEIGAAWVNGKVPLDQGFRVDFDFTVTAGGRNPDTGAPTDNSAAGFAFVIQNENAVPTLHSGLSTDCPDLHCRGEIGYSGVANGFAIELDAGYTNGIDPIATGPGGFSGDTTSFHTCNPLSIGCNSGWYLESGVDFRIGPVARLKGTHHFTFIYNGNGSIWYKIDDSLHGPQSGYNIESIVGSNEAWMGFVGAASKDVRFLHRTEIHKLKIQILRPLVLGISGERGLSVALSGPLASSGINALLNCLDSDQFATHFFSEEWIHADGNGPVWEYYLKPTLDRQVGFFEYAILGHSHGGGDVYLLSQRIINGAYAYPYMTAYVDAIKSDGDTTLLPETRRPFSSQHVNIYQTSGVQGAPTAGSNIALNLNINSTACVEGVGHQFIDNCVVTQRILSSHLHNWLYDDLLLSPAQICAQEGSYCDANSEDYKCTP